MPNPKHQHGAEDWVVGWARDILKDIHAVARSGMPRPLKYTLYRTTGPWSIGEPDVERILMMIRAKGPRVQAKIRPHRSLFRLSCWRRPVGKELVIYC
jgi:hypothetical protein